MPIISGSGKVLLSAVDINIPQWKLVDQPLLPVEGTAVDLGPFVTMFVLLALAAFLMLKLRRRQVARHIVQFASTFFYVVSFHQCGCMLRDLTLGVREINRDNLAAFSYTIVIFTVIPFTLIMGRLFCGWICPLGFLQELLALLMRAVRNLFTPSFSSSRLINRDENQEDTLKFRDDYRWKEISSQSEIPNASASDSPYNKLQWIKYLAAVLGLILVIVAFFSVKPGTLVFIETVMVFWTIALFLIMLFAISCPKKEKSIRNIKYVSVALIMSLYIIGRIYTNSPFCVIFRNVQDYSALLSFGGILLASLILSQAWCRFLCPEGATFGFLTRFSTMQIRKRGPCSNCNRCKSVCFVNAIEKGELDRTACVYCGRCIEECPACALSLEASEWERTN